MATVLSYVVPSPFPPLSALEYLLFCGTFPSCMAEVAFLLLPFKLWLSCLGGVLCNYHHASYRDQTLIARLGRRDSVNVVKKLILIASFSTVRHSGLGRALFISSCLLIRLPTLLGIALGNYTKVDTTDLAHNLCPGSVWDSKGEDVMEGKKIPELGGVYSPCIYIHILSICATH